MPQDASLLPCPCCGYRTIEDPCGWDICRVCWWQDDGQDNEDANEPYGGANCELSLTEARINFLTIGISEADRPDLRPGQEDPSQYERGRVFVLSEDGRGVSEPATGWSARLD